MGHNPLTAMTIRQRSGNLSLLTCYIIVGEEINYMALLDGKTPQELASEIIASTEDAAIMISGLANEELDYLVRSKNAVVINGRGAKWFEHEKESMTKAYLSEVIHSLAKAKKNYLADKEVQSQDNLFRLLRSRGVNTAEAEKAAYPNGVPAPRK
jgi:hypothetical protein